MNGLAVREQEMANYISIDLATSVWNYFTLDDKMFDGN